VWVVTVFALSPCNSFAIFYKNTVRNLRTREKKDVLSL
jgi:hypothetical protein